MSPDSTTNGPIPSTNGHLTSHAADAPHSPAPPHADTPSQELIVVPHVPVSLPPPPPDPAISESQAVESLQRLGLPSLPPKVISDLSTLGLHLGGAGVIRLNRGDVFLSQRQADQTIQLLLLEITAIQTSKSKANNKNRSQAIISLSSSIAALIGAKTKAQSLALDIEKLARPPGAPSAQPLDEPTPKLCFAANENVILTNELHLHSKEPSKP